MIPVVVVVAILGGLGVATAVLAQRAGGHIADGVQVGGVDVGGLTAAQARAKVRRELLAPLDAPIVVRYHGRRWRLTSADAGIHADVHAMVRAAVERSRQGSFVAKAWREATGSGMHASVPARVSYRRSAVTALVARIEGGVNREPRDATLRYTVTSLTPEPAQPGIALNAAALERRIARAITDPQAPRRFRASVRTVPAKVTTADLAARYPVVLTVDRESFRLRLFKHLKLVKTYPVGVGQQGLETPAGLYHIQNKAVDPAWTVPNSPWTGSLAGRVIPGGTPENPLKARWLGIYDGAGIHGIDPSEYGTIGTAASHGCVRMRIEDVVDLYPQVPVHTPIYIA